MDEQQPIVITAITPAVLKLVKAIRAIRRARPSDATKSENPKETHDAN